MKRGIARKMIVYNEGSAPGLVRCQSVNNRKEPLHLWLSAQLKVILIDYRPLLQEEREIRWHCRLFETT